MIPWSERRRSYWTRTAIGLEPSDRHVGGRRSSASDSDRHVEWFLSDSDGSSEHGSGHTPGLASVTVNESSGQFGNKNAIGETENG